MSNGTNTWGVRFSKIVWFEKLLQGHSNIATVKRDRDILFTVQRRSPSDTLSILACDEYVAGMEVVLRALHEFGPLNIIHVGGGWCGYTEEAKRFCLDNKIGIYITDEMSGALWKRDYWAYHKTDEKGDAHYFFKSA
jgi:hypothetical protein